MSSANYSSGGEEVKMGSRAGALGQLRANAALAPRGSRNPTAGHGGEAGLGGRLLLLLLPGSARRGRDSLRAPSRQRRPPAPGATGEGSGASPDGAGQVCLVAPCGSAPPGQPSSFSSSSSSCCCRVASRRGVPPPARGVCGLRGKAGEVAGAELRAAKA